ncbi:hypothetical protein AAH374_001009 [Escherichia coli]
MTPASVQLRASWRRLLLVVEKLTHEQFNNTLPSLATDCASCKGLLPHGKKSRIQCDDDEGIMVDSCVARLRKYKPDEFELLIVHFVIGISLRTIAKKRKCSDGTIRKDLQSALGFVEGVMSML